MHAEYDAVILGLNPTGLGVLQSLGRRGVRIGVADRTWLEIGFASRFGSKYKMEDGEILNWLLEMGERSPKKIIIFPSSDEYLLFLSHHERQLRQHFLLPFPENSLVEQLLNKYLFFELASKFTDRLPASRLLAKPCQGKWSFWPAIIKPLYIHEFRRYFPNCKAWLVHDEEELLEKEELLSRLGISALLQEIITGSDADQYSVSLYMDKQGIPLKTLTARKIRQSPVGFGIGTFVEKVENPPLLDFTVDFLKKIGFSGIAEVEYKLDKKTNVFRLIEVNPRVWTQNKLATYSGSDIISSAYCDLTGGQLPPLPGEARKWFFFPRDMVTSWDYIKKREWSVKEIVSSYGQMAERVGAIWDFSDPVPSLALPFYICGKLLIQNRRVQRHGSNH
jgi:D-aspartate ligase